MSETGKRLENLGITLPVRNRKGQGVVDACIKGDLLFLSAHFPVDAEGKPVYQGKVGAEIDQDTAYEADRLCGLNMIATIKDYIGELDRVDYFVNALGLINSAGDFCEQPDVMTVSYTHLDVYKRQECAMPFSDGQRNTRSIS